MPNPQIIAGVDMSVKVRGMLKNPNIACSRKATQIKVFLEATLEDSIEVSIADITVSLSP